MRIHRGDCLDWLKKFDENSFDSLVTDPPAGISFMGKAWDSDMGGRDEWIKWLSQVMRECNRVLKPGAYALVWAIPRTSHWTTTAIENAGFEIRDVITHLFGSGFPKSLNIGKELKELKEYEGFGTALKPAAEFWILARKPLSEKTVAKNVLKWGTGGLNIDGSRIEAKDQNLLEKNWDRKAPAGFRDSEHTLYGKGELKEGFEAFKKQGRFPANLVFSHTEYCTDDICDIECAIKRLDEQSGNSKVDKRNRKLSGNAPGGNGITHGKMGRVEASPCYSDGGGASRFFYCAKVSASERNAGLEGEPDKKGGIKKSSGRGFSESDPHKEILVKNNHPTVKPIKLMQYLIKLITPPGGTVLDPFMGSGSTGVAAKKLGFEFIGIEREKEYFEIAKKRIQNAKKEK